MLCSYGDGRVHFDAPLSLPLSWSRLIWKYGARGRFLWKGSVRTEGPGVGILVFPPGHPPYAVQLCWFPRLRTAACVHALSDALTSTTYHISSGGCKSPGSLGVSHTLFCSAVHQTSAVTVMGREVPLSLPKREPEDRKETCVLLTSVHGTQE